MNTYGFKYNGLQICVVVQDYVNIYCNIVRSIFVYFVEAEVADMSEVHNVKIIDVFFTKIN